MPYILSPLITESLPPQWFEKATYKKENLYKIEEGKLPPVNYDAHLIYSHSLTHIEAESHVVKDGKTTDHFFENPSMLYGTVSVVKLSGSRYQPINKEKGLYLWEVTKEELSEALDRVLQGKPFAGKILLTTDFYPRTEHGFHDPNYILILSQEAADFLISHSNFNLYGTSWKSSDFKPGSPDRPIHKTLFKKAAILECLDLKNVPEGIYFLVAFPLRIQGASESPVCPVLFTMEELKAAL